ncbi:cytochrome c [Deferribacterales bacterium Es71-Z0220]|uniref:c-type cytochrome n=1 Tax=Deferrivibrio essentukiensis TaxID=2880922 RepID=UPI001F6025A5|nr:cytochrome c [Deferrivibrio essentukiensis]MCB4203596.1 cytochrome c [Deferrivibrio essentukiensis]
MKKIIFITSLLLVVTISYATSDEELFYTKCTQCHGEGIILNKKYDKSTWKKTVKKMKSYGANISSSESKKIVDYLVKNAGE